MCFSTRLMPITSMAMHVNTRVQHTDTSIEVREVRLIFAEAQ